MPNTYQALYKHSVGCSVVVVKCPLNLTAQTVKAVVALALFASLGINCVLGQLAGPKGPRVLR